MKTRITDLLGCQYPVIQGGMAWVAEYHLAAAVSEAGGIGLIGAAIPLILLYFMYQKIIVYIADKFNFIGSMIDFVSVHTVFKTLIPVAVILGVGIGFLGSRLTIRKHLKV